MVFRPLSRRLALALIAAIASTSGCALFHSNSGATGGSSSASKVTLTIVGTNDVHGWLEPHDPPKTGTESMIGGFDVFASYVKVLRKQRPDSVVLVDGGDFFQGTLVANSTEGAAVIRAFNALGYDAATVGNHEFDYGPEGEPVTAMTPGEDPVGNLKRRIAESKFPILTGNIFDRSTGEPVQWENAPRTTIVRRQGIPIGIIGLTTPATPAVTLVQNVSGLEFKPLVPVTIELAKQLREQGAKIIIVTMHAGAGCPPESDARDLSQCSPGELFPYLEALPEGTIDAVIAGHTHQNLAHFVRGVPVIQSRSYSTYFGVIELVYDKATGKLERDETNIWKSVPVCRKVYVATNTCRDGQGMLTEPTFLGEKIEPDRNTVAALKPDIDKVTRLKNEKLGPVLVEPFTRSRHSESSLGDLVTDIMREQMPGTDVAIFNSGGLRADLLTGPLTYGRVFSALPFDNRFAILKLTGAELTALLAKSFSGEHGVLQVSGVTVDVVEPDSQPCEPNGSRVLRVALANGKPVSPTAVYTVVTNDFVAGGGDGFNAVLQNVDKANIQVRHDLPPLREVVVTYLRMHSDILAPPKSAPPRLRFVKPKCAVSKASTR